VEAADILLCQSIWDIADGLWVGEWILGCARATEEAHSVEWFCIIARGSGGRLTDQRPKDLPVDQRVTELLAVVG
jgi:hypothetical protein